LQHMAEQQLVGQFRCCRCSYQIVEFQRQRRAAEARRALQVPALHSRARLSHPQQAQIEPRRRVALRQHRPVQRQRRDNDLAPDLLVHDGSSKMVAQDAGDQGDDRCVAHRRCSCARLDRITAYSRRANNPSGPLPAPSPGAVSIARRTKARAWTTASSSGTPSPSSVAMALDNVQPVPWV